MASSNRSQTSYFLFFLKNFLLMTTAGIAFMFLLLLLGVWQTGHRFLAGVEAFFNAPPATPQIDHPTLIMNQIRGVSELTTAVFVMEAVVPTSQDRTLGNMVIGTTKLLYIARGEVRAGINLENLTSENIQVKNKSVQIQLPSPQILASKIDVERSRVYDYDRGFLRLGPDVAPQLQTLAQQKTLEKIVTTACTEGVLEEASDRAKLAITQLLTTAGYQTVEVTTKTPSKEICQLQSLREPL